MLKLLSGAMLLGTIMAVSVPISKNNQPTNAFSEQGTSIKASPKRLKSSADFKAAEETVSSEMASILGMKPVTVERTKLLLDFAGNEYLFVSFKEGGYGILNVANDDVVETAPFSPTPFSWAVSDVRYVPWIGFYENKGGSYYDARDGVMATVEDLLHLEEESARFVSQSIADAEKEEAEESQMVSEKKAKAGQGRKDAPINHSIDDGLITADHEVPYSWYFKRNYEEFPTNASGYCGYVAASMLLAYNEIFKSTGYFSATQASTYITPYEGARLSTGWDGVPDLSDSFPTDIWGDDIGGSVPSDIHSAIDGFMNGKGKSYGIYDYVWYFATITDPIKDGHPAAYFGNMESPSGGNSFGHVVTVYGYYDNGSLLVHYGWEGYSQVVMSRLGIFAQGGAIAIYNNSAHVHNEYFIERSTGRHYCGCGELMTC